MHQRFSHRYFFGALALLAVMGTAARAQSVGDAQSAAALAASHAGALTPLMTPPMTGRRVGGTQLAIRYGLRDDDGLMTHSVAASALFEVGSNSSLTMTAGVSDGECAGCSPAPLLGLGGDMRVFDAGESGGAGATFHVSVSGDVGYAQMKPGNNSALALIVGAPATVSITTDGESGMRIVPYLMPAFGVGQINGSCGAADCDSGTRFLIGGGVGLWNPITRISASLGVNQVLLDGAKPVFGVNVVFR